MKKHKLNLIGDVNQDLYERFVLCLDSIEKKADKVYIDLCSDGGEAFTALAFYDRIKKCPAEVVITAYGLVASAAVLILAAGDTRRMMKHAWVMVHEDEVVINEGVRVRQAEKELLMYRRLETQWNDILRQATGTPSDVWAKLHQVETYMDAEECKRLNLIQEIV
jgi:ATP-dependent Clp protease protease subunit